MIIIYYQKIKYFLGKVNNNLYGIKVMQNGNRIRDGFAAHESQTMDLRRPA